MLWRVGSSSGWSLRLAPSCANPIGTPAPSLRTERFAPLGSISGIGSGLRTAQRGLRHRAVGREPRPVDPDDLVVLKQPLTPDLMKDTGLLPLLKAPVC